MSGRSVRFAAKAVLMTRQKNLMVFNFIIFPSNLKKTQIKLYAFLNHFSIHINEGGFQIVPQSRITAYHWYVPINMIVCLFFPDGIKYDKLILGLSVKEQNTATRYLKVVIIIDWNKSVASTTVLVFCCACFGMTKYRCIYQI